MILVDTNVLLRLAQLDHPHRQPALDSIELLRVREGEDFAVSTQNLYEMYVVCSRPASANGLGMTSQQAHAEIISTRGLFRVLTETAQVYPAWESLIRQYSIVGKRAHDTRLVAMMIDYHIARILTFNDADFRPYAEITALNPLEVLGRRNAGHP